MRYFVEFFKLLSLTTIILDFQNIILVLPELSTSFLHCLCSSARHVQCQGVPKFHLHLWKEIPLTGFKCITL